MFSHDFDTEAEAIEYYAAKYIWERREQLTPIGRLAEWFKRWRDEQRSEILAGLEG